MKKITALSALLAAVITLSACGASDNGSGTSSESTTTAATEASTTSAATTSTTAATTTAAPVEKVENPIIGEDGSLKVDFSLGKPDGQEIANGWTNGNPFNVTWRKTNVTFNDGKMQLILDEDYPGGDIPYSGGEYRTSDFYGYGRYEVSMKPIKNDGVVSSFFTYTGPTDMNPWDEIDIEFLGKDTTKVQFNYYTNSAGGHEYMYDLGFDASEDFHTYAFEWHEDKIVWFVDGEEVYSADSNLPSTPGKIMMNVWCGKGVDGWLKAFDGTTPLTAEYEWFTYTPFE